MHDMSSEVEVMWPFSWSTHMLQQKCYARQVPTVDNLQTAGTTNAHRAAATYRSLHVQDAITLIGDSDTMALIRLLA